jgi:hypothetical protein
MPLLMTRPLATPLGQRPPGKLGPLEDVLALLTFAGFTGDDALHIYLVLFGYLYGHILTELQEIVERPEETDDVLRLGLHRLTITEFPQVRWHPLWGPTTAPPNSTAPSTSCSSASPPP